MNEKHTLEVLNFSYIDYGIFCLVLLISSAIGVYFGWYKKQQTVNDYLLGGKKMKVFPVGMSLAASYTTAVTILGMPAEIYTYGTQYIASSFGGAAMAFIISTVYLPVFYDLQLTSSYEYLSLRFDRKVHLMVSSICILDIVFFIPLVIYSPTIVFNLVTGVKINYVIGIVSIVCIFYTAIGGLKSVIWTDTIQFLVMNGAIFAIFALGIPNEGGLSEIWKKAKEADRIEFFNMDLNPTTRATLWSVTFGLCTNWIHSMGIHQTCVQKFLAVPSISDAKKVLYIYVIATAAVEIICLLSGLIIFARYSGCDPLTAGIISKADQIVPYYVMDTTRNIPGLPGLFIAGLFSAALSTMSTCFNAAGGILYKDFLAPFLPKDITDETSNRIMKGLVTILGIITTLLALFVEKLGNILPLVVSLTGVTAGTMLGTFTLGMLTRRANTIGAISGTVVAFSIMSWIMLGNMTAVANGDIVYPYRELSVEFCEAPINITNINSNNESTGNAFFLYKLSFMWYSLVGTTLTFSIGLLVSYFTEPPKSDQVKPEYLSPVIRTAEEKEKLLKRDMEMREYSDILPTEKD